MNTPRALALTALAVALNAGVTWALLQAHGGSGGDAELSRKVGSKLQGAGVRTEAAHYYERALGDEGLDAGARANVALTAGGLLLDEGRYDEALGLFYQAELLAPGSDAAREAGKQIVTCLERGGHGAAARTAMASRVDIDAKKKGDGAASEDDPIVARAGTVEVHRSDFLDILSGLPPQLLAQADEAGGQEALLQQAVVMQALYEKAVARGLDKDEAVRRRVESVRRDLLTSALVQQLAAERIRPSPQDLKNYFDAHADLFEGKTFEDAQQEVQSRYFQSRLAELYPELAKDAVGSARIETFPQHLPPLGPSGVARSADAQAPTGDAPPGAAPPVGAPAKPLAPPASIDTDQGKGGAP